MIELVLAIFTRLPQRSRQRGLRGPILVTKHRERTTRLAQLLVDRCAESMIDKNEFGVATIFEYARVVAISLRLEFEIVLCQPPMGSSSHKPSL
jgi:hypothetical protein